MPPNIEINSNHMWECCDCRADLGSSRVEALKHVCLVTYFDKYEAGRRDMFNEMRSLASDDDGEIDLWKSAYKRVCIGRAHFVAELSRVRWLLQRYGRHGSDCSWFNWEINPRKCSCGFKDALAESSLSSQSPAPQTCECGHSDEEHDDGRLCCTHRKSASLFCSCNEFKLAAQPVRCSLCGAPRIPQGQQGAGTCTLIGCKDPLHDNRAERGRTDGR